MSACLVCVCMHVCVCMCVHVCMCGVLLCVSSVYVYVRCVCMRVLSVVCMCGETVWGMWCEERAGRWLKVKRW